MESRQAALFADKFGAVLGCEIALTGRPYRGEEFAQRGARMPVVAGAEVFGQANALAASIAEKPRLSLVELKAHLNRSLRGRVEGMGSSSS